MTHEPTDTFVRKTPNLFRTVRVLAVAHAMLFGGTSLRQLNPSLAVVKKKSSHHRWRDWPYWRGPGSFGIRTEAAGRDDLSPTKGIRWKVGAAGPGTCFARHRRRSDFYLHRGRQGPDAGLDRLESRNRGSPVEHRVSSRPIFVSASKKLARVGHAGVRRFSCLHSQRGRRRDVGDRAQR